MELLEQTPEFLERRKIIIKEITGQLPKFVGDSQRSPILVGVTILENELEKYITSFLIDSPTGREELFETGPLSTFSAKISVARRLGLINNEFQDSMDCMRKIRNMVNKYAGIEVFKSEQVSSIIESMHRKYNENKNYREIENTLSVVESFFLLKQKNETKTNFILLLLYLVYTLQTGKILAEKKQYRAKLVMSFP